MDNLKEVTLKRMAEILEPFGLHDLEDVCQRIYMDCGSSPLHTASLLAMAVEKCCDPIGGEDGFGDLHWQIGPHKFGLPYVQVVMEFDGEKAMFSSKLPLAPAQLERDFHADRKGDKFNGVVLDYIDEQLDEDDRSNVWFHLCEDGLESVRCQESANRLRQSPDLQPIFLNAIQTDNKRGMLNALALGAKVNEPDSEGNMPLHIAAGAGHHRLILPLLHEGAWVDEVNHKGQSPLHLAAARACGHGCLVLLAHNADPKRKDNRGHTPIPEPFEGYKAHVQSL